MEQLDQLVQQAAADFGAAADGAQLEQAKARYLGKAGSLTERLKSLGKLDPDARREAGAAINAAARELGLTYSVFMNGLKKAAIEIDRKVLADLAVFDKPAFAAIAEQARAKLAA